MPAVAVLTQNQFVTHTDAGGNQWPAALVHQINGGGTYNLTIFKDGGPATVIGATPTSSTTTSGGVWQGG